MLLGIEIFDSQKNTRYLSIGDPGIGIDILVLVSPTTSMKMKDTAFLSGSAYTIRWPFGLILLKEFGGNCMYSNTHKG